ncbi:MAG: hypothetical protein RLZZ630_192 [Bacteroidota bacterium]|jgi:UDP-N-acetylmuramate--alanine ligase
MNTRFDNISQVYFLGIGGIGMSALARYFLASGKIVAGYDRTPTPLTHGLEREGMKIHYEDLLEKIPASILDEHQLNSTLIVVTPAIPSGHAELNWFKERGYDLLKRSEVLGLITGDVPTMAVAGTHGKTTTSTILVHILRIAGRNCTAFLGGISANYGSNLVLGVPSRSDHEIVVEADEFDRSFLTLHPEAAIVTSMDADHLDIYGSADEMQRTYRRFASQVSPDGLLLVRRGLDMGQTSARQLSYSIENDGSDYRAERIRVEDGMYIFDLVTPGFVVEGLRLGLPGRHNVENAVAASALALERGVDMLSLKEALSCFRGVQRRFDVIVRTENTTYIDDYAHHPEEIRAVINSARELYPGKRISVVFQPHLYSRTRDFADGFAQALSLADAVYLMDIYPARELPIPGVDSLLIFKSISCTEKKLLSREELLSTIASNMPQVLMTLGAGDIDQLIIPIQKILEKK